MPVTNIENKCNLFIYGSLRDPSIFESVCGLSFTLKPSLSEGSVLLGELALLPNYRRVSPDNVYFYAVEDENAKIEGILIYDVPPEAMRDIDRYEGKFYQRDTVSVTTAGGQIYAEAYLASHSRMKQQFGDRFHVNLIHELWLRKRIARFFQEHTRPGEKTQDAYYERKARRELLATTERDLVISHLGSAVVSDFYLEHELDRPIPSIKHLFGEQQAKPYLDNYIKFVIKQVLLNHFEEMIQQRYRYQLDHLLTSWRYFSRAISLLVALRMINNNNTAVDVILNRSTRSLPLNGQYDLIDYVKYAISAAESIFDARLAQAGLDWIRANRQPGIVPMGAELEMSNIGYMAVGGHHDDAFDNFRYFNDFALDVLTWKIGGYIDDHRGTDKLERKCGFLELAPGRLNVKGELSKPATSDPWILNQLIRNIIEFYPIPPHSLHLTFQLRKSQVKNQQILPLGFIKCLLALGGGTQVGSSGKLWISRMHHSELEQNVRGEEFSFTRTSKRRARLEHDEEVGNFIRRTNRAFTQQYKFIRLDARANYEALIMALKGLQIDFNPADYLTVEQLAKDKRLGYNFRLLKDWAMNPTPLSRGTISKFLNTIKAGLMKERHGKPAHKLHYIEWAMAAVDVQLRLFNKQVEHGRRISGS